MTVLAGLLGLGLVFTQSAFKATNEEVKFGVFDYNSATDRFQVTNQPVNDLHCGTNMLLPCKISVPVSTVPYEESGVWYIDNDDSVTEVGQGGYN